jgi:hypothetical protein
MCQVHYDDVKELPGKAPGATKSDWTYIKALIDGGKIFSAFGEEDLEVIKEILKARTQLILAIPRTVLRYAPSL